MSIVKNTEKSPGVLRRLAVSQTPVKDHQLTLQWKTRKDSNNNNNNNNLIISERSELAQRECKTKHDRVGKVIHWELCKKFKFDHTNKWYMHNPESFLEKETHKLLWDFEIQTNHIISARRLDLVIVNKKENPPNCGFCRSDWSLGKTEGKWKGR